MMDFFYAIYSHTQHKLQQQDNWTMYCRLHGETCVIADTHPIRQTLTLPTGIRRKDSSNLENSKKITLPRNAHAWIPEKTHASIETALKISTRERRFMWHEYVQIAVMNKNTT